jgi:hypothetical protein
MPHKMGFSIQHYKQCKPFTGEGLVSHIANRGHYLHIDTCYSGISAGTCGWAVPGGYVDYFYIYLSG